MKHFKKKKNENIELSPEEQEEDKEKVDTNSMEVVVDRVEHGLIGTLRIENSINHPIFKNGDLVHLCAPVKLKIKDFVLYHNHDEYFLRRIIKYIEEDIYVAGDNEHEYHVIHKDDIIGKVVSRQRKTKRLSFSLTPKKRIYTFKKVNLAYFRLKNRIINYEQEVNNESLAQAIASVSELKTTYEKNEAIKIDIDLDTDLQAFLNPDTLVHELEASMNEEASVEEEDSEAVSENDETVELTEEEGIEGEE